MMTSGYKIVGGSTNEALKKQIRAFGTHSLWRIGRDGEPIACGDFAFGTVKELRETLRVLKTREAVR